MRALTREEIHHLRPCIGHPMSEAPLDAIASAVTSDFSMCEHTYRDEVGFQCAAICAFQNGKMEGKDFPSIFADAEGDDLTTFSIARKILSRPDDETRYWVVTVGEVARRLIYFGHPIDIKRLYADLTGWYDEPRDAFFRWLRLIGKYDAKVNAMWRQNAD